MSSLDRLREILRSAKPPVAGPSRELTYEPVSAGGDLVRAAREVPALDGVRTVDTPFGAACCVERTFHGDARHGIVPVADCAQYDPDALATLCGRALGAVGASSALPVFLDLETTGLHGGAGTVAFLVGLGGFDEHGDFRTRQFFLGGFAGERAMLHAVAEAVEGAPLVVTYNGGSFDLPMMETRWLFHRLVPALEGRPHLDMLPPARRLWRGAMSGEDRSCRLVALEEAVLGFTRVGDVPGFEIPERYFQFLRTGDGAPLEPVLLHNRLDLLSLAVLMARAQRLVREGPAATRDARECTALGRLYERAGRVEEAAAAYRLSADHDVSDRASREQAWHALALLLRRRRRFGEAADAWRQVLRHTDRRSALGQEAVEALAIHHEHRERNLSLARALALKALGSESDEVRRAGLRHRLKRLDQKLASLRVADADLPRVSIALPWEAE
jgi:hypothetical protein